MSKTQSPVCQTCTVFKTLTVPLVDDQIFKWIQPYCCINDFCKSISKSKFTTIRKYVCDIDGVTLIIRCDLEDV